MTLPQPGCEIGGMIGGMDGRGVIGRRDKMAVALTKDHKPQDPEETSHRRVLDSRRTRARKTAHEDDEDRTYECFR